MQRWQIVRNSGCTLQSTVTFTKLNHGFTTQNNKQTNVISKTYTNVNQLSKPQDYYTFAISKQWLMY